MRTLADLMLPDLFISHASEDKADFVRPLVDELTHRGLRVWLDEHSMRLGSSVRRSIDDGIKNSKAGVVVLSTAFLQKNWTKAEADALISEMVTKDKLVIPIWLGVTHAQVREFSPILADRFALHAPADIDDLARRIYEALDGITLVSAGRLRTIVRRYLWADEETENFLAAQCIWQVKRMGAYARDLERQRAEVFNYDGLTDEEYEARECTALELMGKRHEWLTSKYDFPPGVWLEGIDEIDVTDEEYLIHSLGMWVSGVLGIEATNKLFAYVDDTLDLDVLLIFFGLPNFSVTRQQRDLLYEAIPLIGDSFNLEDDQRSAHALEKLLDRIATKPEFEPDE